MYPDFSDVEGEFNMTSPKYMFHNQRMASYKKNWPQSLKYLVEPLCDAGFYYAQKGDEVRCFCCGGILKNWDDAEQPWDQHAIWFPKCDYINMVKGSTFRNNVRERIVVSV